MFFRKYTTFYERFHGVTGTGGDIKSVFSNVVIPERTNTIINIIGCLYLSVCVCVCVCLCVCLCVLMYIGVYEKMFFFSCDRG